MIEDKKVGENEKCIFYTNSMCREYSGGYYVIMAELKDTGYKTYLLCNKKGEPVYEDQSIEGIFYHHLALEKRKEKDN